MNYKERWSVVRDARKAWKKARRAKRKLSTTAVTDWRSRNGAKAVLARKMRACPTECEAIFFDALKENGFGFDTQVQIGPYIADALIYPGKTVVEIDGPIHDSRKDYDLARDRFMWNSRYRVIRFTNKEVKGNITAVILRLREFIAEVGR